VIVGFAALPSPVLKISTRFAVESLAPAVALAEANETVMLAAVVPKSTVHAHSFAFAVECYYCGDVFKVDINLHVRMSADEIIDLTFKVVIVSSYEQFDTHKKIHLPFFGRVF
jgi:hypothetical protein